MEKDWIKGVNAFGRDTWMWKDYEITGTRARSSTWLLANSSTTLQHLQLYYQLYQQYEYLGNFETLDEAKEKALRHFKKHNPISSKIMSFMSFFKPTQSGSSQSGAPGLKKLPAEQKSSGTGSQMELPSQNIISGTTHRPTQVLMLDVGGRTLITPSTTPSNETVTGDGPQYGSADISTEPSGTSAATITHQMPIVEVIEHLRQHGCVDVTGQLDNPKCSEYPVSAGGFGDIFCGTLHNGNRVSLKCLRLHMDPTNKAKQQLKRAARELYVWSKCDHPNVLTLIGVAQYRNQIAMVSPWMENGNLRGLLSRKPQLDRWNLCVQIAAGVAYLHSEGIVHGDIKGDNILFSQDCTPKLADFGNAALREYTLQFTDSKSRAGISLNWAAPEVLREETGLTFEADVYSLGLTMLEVITGRVPYAGIRDYIIMTKISTGTHPTRPDEHLPPHDEQADRLWSLLTSCWASNPLDRPSAIEVRDKMKWIVAKGMSGDSA